MGVSIFSFAWTFLFVQVFLLSPKKVDSVTHFTQIEHSCGLASVYQLVQSAIHRTDSG